MAERDLVVRFIGDDKDLQRAFTRTDRSLKGFNQTARGALSGFGSKSSLLFGSGAFIGTAAFSAALAKSITNASNLNEEISKSAQIFGESDEAIQRWAETTAKSIGVARVQALQATGTFGNLFRVVDVLPAQASEMSTALVELAADLASFNNASIEDVLLAIRSGLIGEAEPLRRYGVLLSEVRVGQAAMAATGKDNVKELTNQEKALARYNIILQDANPAQGDFARTSGGLANQTRILRAQLSDLSAELGGNLVPSLIKVTQVANGLFDALDAFRHGGGGQIRINVEEADLASLELARQKIADLKGESDLLVIALDQVISRLQAVAAVRPDDRAGPRGPGAVAASNATVEERNRQQKLERAKRELEQSRKRFAEFIKGLGLKLDKAGLTQSFGDDLAVLREIERAILKQIQVEGRTFELEQQLVDNRLKQAAITGQRVAEADRKTKETATKTKSATAAGKSPQQKRIEDQFEALGLTAEGGQRTPGAGALMRRLGNLRDQIKGTTLDTTKTGSELDRIAKVLSGKFGKVGKDVRSAILQMFNDISSALEGEGAKKGAGGTGEITQGGIRSTQMLLRGLDLTDEERRIIQQRNLGRTGRRGLSAFGFGIGQPASFATGGATGAGAGGNMIITGPITVVTNDPNDLMKKLQKKGRRTAGGRRGRHGGANLGLQ